MSKKIIVLFSMMLFLWSHFSYASPAVTKRFPQFSNQRVKVWNAVIYPSKKQMLKMHRHDHDRLLVAFNSGILKIRNNKGRVHFLKLKKEHAYYLKRDRTGELHTDENMSHHPIKVMVIELRK